MDEKVLQRLNIEKSYTILTNSLYVWQKNGRNFHHCKKWLHGSNLNRLLTLLRYWVVLQACAKFIEKLRKIWDLKGERVQGKVNTFPGTNNDCVKHFFPKCTYFLHLVTGLLREFFNCNHQVILCDCLFILCNLK